MASLSWQWRVEALAAVAFMILGVVVWHAGDVIPPSFMDTGFGAGLLPKWLGGVLILLAALLLLETMTAGRRATDPRTAPPAEPDHEASPRLRGAWKPGALLLLLVLMLVNADYQLIPFYLSVAIFIFAVILMLEGLGKKALVIASSVAFATTVVVWIVFSQLFMVIIQ
ncbi:tripartite tricarboxylate transporter TctB family protein [Salinicola lusitanus]|uniref:Tripartite tricarboxylate transporter TctB family protein n=1 Tax=Salinicola lusitanus TaxID=1949085 RepID=A0ABZ3CUQ7_9GAMM|nr:tripartite tricarboxylate transporter TctB family protein [Salinicola lusitanus]